MLPREAWGRPTLALPSGHRERGRHFQELRANLCQGLSFSVKSYGSEDWHVSIHTFLLLVHTPIPPSRKDVGSFHFQGSCHVIEQTILPATRMGCLPQARNCSVQRRRGRRRRLGGHRQNSADGQGREEDAPLYANNHPSSSPPLILSAF